MVSVLGQASFSPIFVVIGARAPLFRSTVKEVGFAYVENLRWQRGRASSIKAGLTRLGEGCPGVLVWPVDHPFVSGETLRRLHEMGKRRAGNWIVPTFEGHRGHPPLISREVSETILTQEDDWPLNTYPRGHPSEVVEVPGDDSFVVGNLDTREAFDAALRQYRAREARWAETETRVRRG
jgi:CTP:molybdopterin cytidylyltransferase MocA